MTKLTQSWTVRVVNFLLNFFWILLWIGIVFVIGYTVYLSFDSGGGSFNIQIPINFETAEKGSIQFSDDQVSSMEVKFAKGTAVISRPVPTPLLIFYFISSEFLFAVIVYILYHLRKIFQSLKQENPFTRENGKRLRIIGFTIIISSLVWQILILQLTSIIRQNGSIEGVIIGQYFDLKLGFVYLGLIILIIAEVFRIGTEMKEEQELTI